MNIAGQQCARPVIKKPYNRPTLTKYGTVARLTQGVGSKNGDGGHAMMS